MALLRGHRCAEIQGPLASSVKGPALLGFNSTVTHAFTTSKVLVYLNVTTWKLTPEEQKLQLSY